MKFLSLSLLVLSVVSLRAQVVINEIMYHPSSENVLEEYLELHNRALTNVNLSGWRITRGVDFDFPTNTIIPANGYLVVAAHVPTFQAKYPSVANVVGNWAGLLSNSGNTIELENAAGDEVDQVEYADEGDWAMRQRGPVDVNHRGWIWLKLPDGLGKSLELRNSGMPNEYGQNWGPSRPDQGTPGRVNSVSFTNIPPIILEVQHAPIVPGPTDPVTITARILDETASGITARLYYRLDSTAPGAFTELSMFDDGAHNDGLAGDGIFAAELAPQANNTVVEFFVQATDAVGNVRTFPGPANVELFRVGTQADAIKNWPEGQLITSVQGLRITNVTVSPFPPPANTQITIAAMLTGRRTDPMPVTLFYRSSLLNPYSSTPMFDDGLHDDGDAEDGVYVGYVPGVSTGTIIDAYIDADDGLGGFCQWRPSRMGANLLYQVDNLPQNAYANTNNALPIYKAIMTELERAELAGIPPSGDRNSDAQMNATWISLDATGPELRYQTGIRNRGHGSRGANPPNYRVNFSSDNPWKGFGALNLNTRQVHIQHFGSVLALKSGAAGAYSRAVKVRINNVDRADGGAPMFGAYAANEAINSDWADLHFPFDGNGNVYRAIRDIAPSQFSYRGPGANAYHNTWFKESNVSEDDWTDLINMLRIMGTNDLFDAASARNVVNVEQWMTHLAVMNLFGNNETGLNNGYNDDYFMYRGVNDPRFILMYYDLDQILGQGGSMGTGADIFSATLNNGSGVAFNQFMRSAEFEPIYYQTLQRLLDTTFSEAEFNSLIDQTLGSYVTSATVTAIKNWMNGRRISVQGQISGFVQPTAGVATISGEPRSPTTFRSATLTVGGEGITSYRFRLNSGAFGGETAVATPIQLFNLPNGSSNTVYVIGRNASGVWQDEAAPTVSQAWIVNTSWPAVRINEVLAANDSAVNHQGTFPDIIELYNEGSVTLSLAGMRLTDDPAVPDKFAFPPNTSLAAGAYLLVYANDPDGTAGFHTGFGLDQNGEGVYLFDSVADGGALLDSVEFGAQLSDRSFGRTGNSGTWALTQPAFPGANALVLTGNHRALQINEWLASGVSPFADDFIEIFNGDALPVDLGGLFLTDQPIGAPRLSRIRPLTFAAGNGYAVLIADGNPDEPGHLDFQLSSEFGEIALSSAPLGTLDCVSYGPQRTDGAMGRCPSGGVAIRSQVVATPGFGNACPPAPIQPELIPLITGTYVWKYESSGNYPAIGWMTDQYDDSFWPSGQAILGNETCGCTPEPINTFLFLTQPRQMTFYFRTTFDLPPNASFTALQLEHAVDDGAVFYLNGQEILRYGIPPGVVVTNTTPAARVGDANAYSAPVSIPLSYLRPGVNLMAAELHNQDLANGDTVFGMRLSGVIVTNTASAAGIIINEVLADNASLAEADGSTPDWVELYNPSDSAVDLADMSLSDTLLEPRRWVFPSPSIIPGNGYFLVRLDSDLPMSSTNTGFGLNASTDSVYLFDTAGNGGALLDAVSFGVQAPDFSIGRIPNGSGDWQLTVPKLDDDNLPATLGDVTQLKINEWMAAPSSGSDWFEVYNPNPQPVAIGGCFFSDALGDLDKSPVPALSFLGSGSNAWHRFEADNDPDAGANHVRFALGAGGEDLVIVSSNGVVIDFLTFPRQTLGISEGRLPDGAATVVQFPNSVSPANPNYTVMLDVVVNEVLSHSDNPLEDAIELHNTTASAMDISGWWLSDSRNALRKYQLPSGTILPPHGFHVFYEYQFNNADVAPIPFALSSSDGDDVLLSATGFAGALNGLRATAEFDAGANGVSFGRFVNSQGMVDYPALTRRTFGQDGAFTVQEFRAGMGASNAYPIVGPVLITEIMYHPPDLAGAQDNVGDEYVELHNPTANAVALYDPAYPTNTWRLRDAVDFDFPPNTVIAPGGYLIVVSFDPATNAPALALFRSHYGANSVLAGPYSGKLDNSSDSIELYRPDTPNPGGKVPYILVERILYQDTAPWPLAPDGFGESLQRISMTTYGNDHINWTAGPPALGPSGAGDHDSDGMPNSWEDANGLNPNNEDDAEEDADEDGFTNLQEYRAGTDPQDVQSFLQLGPIAVVPGALVIEFHAAAGITYSIIYRPEVEVGPWTKLIDVPAQASAGFLRVFDPSPDPKRFYRLVTPSLQD